MDYCDITYKYVGFNKRGGSMRRIEKLMKGWRFTGKDGVPVPVDLPHTWNNFDGQDGGDDYYRGTCLYELDTPKPDVGASERVYLQFHGVNASARVLFNGMEIVNRDGGYATFRVDVTELLEPVNHIAVYADNSVNDRVYPQKADFTFYGGIYRDVEWLIVNSKHFDLDYCGGPGFKYDARVQGKDAVVHVVSYNDVPGAVTKVTLTDADGMIVAGGVGEDVYLNVKNVHLWDGMADPYLYDLRCDLYDGSALVDQVSCKCGIRSFSFDPKAGFFLNGRSYPLHGVSRHQDYRDRGNAITRADHDRDMALIREVGANTIRLAHYQHDQYFYDLCDKYGFIVWAEIPYISEHLANGDENTRFQMTELITQNYNHPSIVMWGVSNEITISGHKLKKQMLANHKALNDLCHRLDPTRPTTLANFAMCLHWNPVAHITDIVGWNLYLGWYTPFLWLNDAWVKLWKLLYPKRCLCYSEYGAEGMPNLHGPKPKRGDNSEEYQLKYHEYMLKFFDRNPQIWGYYYWNMFDFAADARNQGGEPGMNHKGMITFDRNLKKDVFYLYQAHWTHAPMLHLCGKRYEYRTEAVSEVKVYSTLPEVSLYHNGKLVETKKGDKVFTFKVQMEAENHLEVKAGDLTDSAVIYKTDKLPEGYKLAKGDSSNWM